MTHDNRRMDYRPQRRSFLRSGQYSKPRIHSLDDAKDLNWSDGLKVDSTSEHFIDIKTKRQKAITKPAKRRQSKSSVLKRQGLKKLPPFKPRKIKHSPLKVAAAVFGVALISLGVISLFAPNESAPTQQQASVKSAQDVNNDSLASNEPTIEQLKSYKVAPDAIRYFQARKIDLNSRVYVVSMEGDQLARPNNIHDIGWYKGSSRPGAGSATLLTGTIASDDNPGALRLIGSLRPDDIVDVFMGDGSSHSYRVVTTKTYPAGKVSIEELSLPIEVGKEGLNLVGMSDRFDVARQEYEPSYAVFAVKI